MHKLGVIGMGYRIFSEVLPPLFELSNDICVTAVADLKTDATKEKIAAKPYFFAKNVALYTDAAEMLKKEALDGVIIGTNCSTHTDMAILAMQKHVPIFLEKPVCISMEQWERLAAANKQYKPQVMVSFPLRFTTIVNFVREILQSGKIGDVLQVNAFNDVTYGGTYYHNWYRDETKTGGLWLQKATHDFDYLNSLLQDPVTEVFARSVRKLYKGDMPLGTTCDTCEKNMTCPESPHIIKNIYQDTVHGLGCAFAVDTGNDDCGTALLRCKSGAIVSYAQNFFVRHKAARRGARFYGTKATLEFDFVTATVNIYSHTSPMVETHTIDDGGRQHSGGDLALARQYLAMLNKETDRSFLNEGLESAYLCLLAKESSETGKNLPTTKLNEI